MSMYAMHVYRHARARADTHTHTYTHTQTHTHIHARASAQAHTSRDMGDLMETHTLCFCKQKIKHTFKTVCDHASWQRLFISVKSEMFLFPMFQRHNRTSTKRRSHSSACMSINNFLFNGNCLEEEEQRARRKRRRSSMRTKRQRRRRRRKIYVRHAGQPEGQASASSTWCYCSNTILYEQVLFYTVKYDVTWWSTIQYNKVPRNGIFVGGWLAMRTQRTRVSWHKERDI